jgi:hypothetical protein
MADQLSLRGGTTAEHAVFTGANKEVTVDTTKKTLVVNDGATVGGHPLMRENASNSALALGSAGTPSLKFSGDTNTGIYSPGADQVAISTGGTEYMRLTSAGNVGINSTAPVRRLHVAVAGSDPQLRLQDTSATESIWAGIEFNGDTNRQAFIGKAGSSDLLIINDNNSGALRFSTNATERARIDSSGRLLVGTSSVSSSVNQIEVVTASSGVGFSTYSTLESALRSSYSAYAGLQLAAYQVDSGAPYTKNVDIVANSDATVPSQMRFLTKTSGAASPTERMRISNVGDSSMFGTLSVLRLHTETTAGTVQVLLQGRYGATSGTPTSGTSSILVYTNGNVQNTNNSYGAISDIKLKENIVNANSQWDDLKALQVRNYNFKEGQTHTQIGLVAQEVELVSPGLVSETPDRDAEGNDLGTVTKSVNYSVLYMKAVKALQEAMERIEILEARITALESA